MLKKAWFSHLSEIINQLPKIKNLKLHFCSTLCEERVFSLFLKISFRSASHGFAKKSEFCTMYSSSFDSLNVAPQGGG